MDIVVYVLASIIGLCVGSFLNVVIYRVPLEMSIAFPSSHCTKCGYNLKWYDNTSASFTLIVNDITSSKANITIAFN